MKLVVAICCMASAANAALIAGWNFNDLTPGTAPTPISADHGSGSFDLSQIANSSDAVIGGTSSGTIVNEFSGDTAGRDLRFASGGGAENGKFLIFSMSMAGYKSLVISYATEQTGTAFTAQDWSYSIDGGANYTSFVTVTPNAGSYAIATIDLSSVVSINNVSSVLFELTVSGATGSSGSDHFDNIQFNASPIPEPAEWGAVSGIGLLTVAGLHTWRTRRVS
jgi:hypothetical protein